MEEPWWHNGLFISWGTIGCGRHRFRRGGSESKGRVVVYVIVILYFILLNSSVCHPINSLHLASQTPQCLEDVHREDALLAAGSRGSITAGRDAHCQIAGVGAQPGAEAAVGRERVSSSLD